MNAITPNAFEGSDAERIQAAISRAVETTHEVVIPSVNSNGTNVWLVDRAILLPSHITVILDDCTIQLSDDAIDNIFRSDNVGEGATDVKWNRDISLIGVGDARVKGATNPRSTGENKSLALDAVFESPLGRGKMSYGTDAGKDDRKQKGDWRNHGILIAYVDGFTMRNITIERTGCWAVTHERVINAELSQIRIVNPPEITVDGETHYVANRDGINLRHGCKNFRIHDISGETGDDFIALSLLRLDGAEDHGLGNTIGAMLSTTEYTAPDDDIENISISNVVCKTKNHGIALRAVDVARIHDVYIDGLVMRRNPKIGSHQSAILFGGRGYGTPNPAGNMSNVLAMNLMSDAPSALIHVEAIIADCTFLNGVYSGEGEYVVSYHDFDDATAKYTTSKGNAGKSKLSNVREVNLIEN